MSFNKKTDCRAFVDRLALACWFAVTAVCVGQGGEEKHANSVPFEDALAGIEQTTDPDRRACLVSRLVGQIESGGAPLILDDNRAAFVYLGKADLVGVFGDITNWAGSLEMQNLPGTDLHYVIAEMPTGARIEYMLSVDGENIMDPLCPHRVPSGLGGASELAMPTYQHHPVFSGEIRQGKRGGYDRVERQTLFSDELGYEKEIHVYRPIGVDATSRVPTVYFHDGRDYIEYAHMPALLDYLISGGLVEPLNAVFISPPNRHKPGMPNRVTEYGLNPDYVAFVADELVPFIDERFGSSPQREARMTLGDSYAGLVSAYLAHSRSDVFALACSQSGYVSCEDSTVIKAYAKPPSDPIRLYVQTGVYERSVGKGWLPDKEIDFLAANRRFSKVLQARGYDFVYREYPEGHTWGNWRRYAADALVHFFGAESSNGAEETAAE